MSSQLEAIYAAIQADMGVTFQMDGQPETPTIYGLDTLPASIETTMLPCRLLLPSLETGGEFVFTTLGNAGDAKWQISDTLYFSDAKALGLVYPNLVRYVVAHQIQVKAHRDVLRTASIVSVKYTIAGFRYPNVEGAPYRPGVEAVYTIEELVD